MKVMEEKRDEEEEEFIDCLAEKFSLGGFNGEEEDGEDGGRR